MPEMVERLVKLQKTVSGIQQRTVERTADIKLQIVENIIEETVEVSQVQCSGKAVDTFVGMQRQVLVIQTVQKNMEVSAMQFMDKVVDSLVVAQRQIHLNRNVQDAMEIPQLQHTDQVVDVHVVVLVAQVPRVYVVVETVEIPQLPFVEKIVVIAEIQTVQGPQTSESLNTTKNYEVTVAGKIDHETVVRNVVQNIELDSCIDDFSSVDSERSGHQDCEILFHAGKQSP